MTLAEYFKVKRTQNLSGEEIRAFGIVDCRKGWVKRNLDKTITREQLEYLYYSDKSSQKTRTALKTYLLGRKVRELAIDLGDKFVYLISNENGRLKIGISEDPIKRAANISTAGGYHCKLEASWSVVGKGNAAKVERELHEQFKKDRILGEWFSEKLDRDKLFEAMSRYPRKF